MLFADKFNSQIDQIGNLRLDNDVVGVKQNRFCRFLNGFNRLFNLFAVVILLFGRRFKHRLNDSLLIYQLLNGLGVRINLQQRFVVDFRVVNFALQPCNTDVSVKIVFFRAESVAQLKIAHYRVADAAGGRRQNVQISGYRVDNLSDQVVCRQL